MLPSHCTGGDRAMEMIRDEKELKDIIRELKIMSFLNWTMMTKWLLELTFYTELLFA